MHFLDHLFYFSIQIGHGFMTLMSDHGHLDLALRLKDITMVASRLSRITRLQMLLLWEVIPKLLGTFPQQKFLMLRR